MLDIEFLESVADFYGSVSVDEFVERLGVSTTDLMEIVEDLIFNNLDTITEEMEYDTNEAVEDDFGEDDEG